MHDDAISREAVLNCLNVVWGDYFIMNEIYERINALPSVNPQSSEHFIDGVHAMGYREGYKDAQKQKSGHWIIDSWLWSCDKCGKTYHKDNAREFNYCPNCGAKMFEP